MPNDDVLLRVENLRAYYPLKKGLIRAVDDVSFEVKEGECLGLLGESGCGKSSLALAVLGLFEKIARFEAGASNIPGLRERFDEEGNEKPGVHGKVFFRGKELTALPEDELVKIRGKEITLIPQGLGHALNPQYSVGMQAGEPVEIHKEDVRLLELKKQVLEYLDLVQLADSGTRFVLDPGSFSGGEAQRILIAISIISGPYLVIADEPTSALDVTIQRQILDVLEMIRDDFDVSTLLISHDAGVIADLADRVAVMYAGKIMELGDAIQIYHEPAHPYTRGLMASYPRIAMMQMKERKGRPRLRGIQGNPPEPTNIPSGCPFHPRCEFAIGQCSTDVPEYREVEQGHFVRCIRWEELN